MAGLLGQIRKLNGFGDRAFAEPFAGGAGAALSLLYREETPEIFINDADRSIHDFWWMVLNRPEAFKKKLRNTPVNMAQWHRQRNIYTDRTRVPRLRRGFSAFYLNRCNRSGIIMNGGPIGGVEQEGRWKLDARFNKPELQRRCEKIAQYHGRIRVSGQDGIDFINDLDAARVFFFIDPPYFVKGPTLYLNALDADYHRRLAAVLKSMTDAAWVLTYDDCAAIRRMYRSWATIRPFRLRYSAADSGSGKEVLITPKWMRLPPQQRSAAIAW